MTDAMAELADLGISLPSPAYLIGVLAFGVIGLVAFSLGRKRSRPGVRWLGLVLMLYPYAVWNTAAVYAVGFALCAALWWVWRRPQS